MAGTARGAHTEPSGRVQCTRPRQDRSSIEPPHPDRQIRDGMALQFPIRPFVGSGERTRFLIKSESFIRLDPELGRGVDRQSRGDTIGTSQFQSDFERDGRPSMIGSSLLKIHFPVSSARILSLVPNDYPPNSFQIPVYFTFHSNSRPRTISDGRTSPLTSLPFL
jgi:hypothetical protein